MERSFKEYISNPLGNKNTVFSSREMYRNMYTDKFNLIMVRENSKIDYKLYRGKDDYYIYLKIPSEKIKEFYYDVVIQFIPQKASSSMEMSLDNYAAKYYSNDPSFVFTFAHAFIENNMFITDLKPKMSKQAVKKVAKEKNPDNQIGYVKSLYFAFLFMKSRGLFKKIHYEIAEKYDKKKLLSQIMEADEKIRLRTEAAEALVKEKKKKEVKKSRNNIVDSIDNTLGNVKFVKKVNSIGKTGSSVKSRNVSRRTKTTKRI